MVHLLKVWYQRNFCDPESSILLMALVLGFLFIVFLGQLFAPLLIALVVAYLLDVVVCVLEKRLHIPRVLGFSFVYLGFLALIILGLLLFLPLISRQIAQVANDIPQMVAAAHRVLADLPNRYPNFISDDMVSDLVNSTSFSKERLATVGKALFSFSVASIPSIVSWLVYLLLVPFLILFLLKDKAQLLEWTKNYIPAQRGLLVQVAKEMKSQLGNYLKGKVFEMIVVGIAAYVCFLIFGLNYAALLALLVGVSVLIPYVGMVIVTIPIVIIGLLQFGMTPIFFYMLATYLIIQAVDGNVLVPILFSEAVNLHPIAIVVAILFFGGIWGFWGLIFAIPLATLVKSVISSWAKHQGREAVNA